jgi:hypothetical protein
LLCRFCHLLNWVTKRAAGLQYLSARLRQHLSMCKATAIRFSPAFKLAGDGSLCTDLLFVQSSAGRGRHFVIDEGHGFFHDLLHQVGR